MDITQRAIEIAVERGKATIAAMIQEQQDAQKPKPRQLHQQFEDALATPGGEAQFVAEWGQDVWDSQMHRKILAQGG